MPMQVMGDNEPLEMKIPQNYYDTWNRHDSIALSSTASVTKGLRNLPGENNCFLNSAVQVFWHIDVFRRSYRRLSGHTCMGNSCIFCALKVIFTQFQYSDHSSHTPDALRLALAETFADQQRFQLGHMDDAAECFENILRRIHYHIATDHNEDTCVAGHCLPHQKFAMTVFDQLVCPCGAKSDPLKFHEMVHYISATSLTSQAKIQHESGEVLHPDRFGLLLRSAAAMGDIRDCPGYCGKRIQIRRTLLNCPDVVSIGLIWPTDRPSGELISNVVRSIGTTIMLQDVFHSVVCDDPSKLPKLHLVGLVCYYGKHYSTFLFHSKLQAWVYFDDATVKEVGPRWEMVVEKFCKSRYQPLLLLYTNPNASPLNVDTAPKKTTMAEGYQKCTQAHMEEKRGKERENRAPHRTKHKTRRSMTPGPDSRANHDVPARRAMTPGPESTYEKEPAFSTPEHHRHQSFLAAITPKVPEPALAKKSRPWLPGGKQSDDRTLHDDYVYHSGLSQTVGNNQFSRPSAGNYEDMGGVPTQTNFPSANKERESFKRGNNLGADVIRCNIDVLRNNESGHVYAQHGRSMSQSFDEENDGYKQRTSNHSNQNYDHVNMDSTAVHGPVQSGLATLPRKKKSGRSSTTPDHVDAPMEGHERQGSTSSTGSVVLNPNYQGYVQNRSEYADQAGYLRKSCSDHGPMQGSDMGNVAGHDRQVSSLSQASQSTQSTITHELGRDLGDFNDIDQNLVNRGHQLSQQGSPDYINRRMVETILSRQHKGVGVQRQASSVSSNSVRSNTSNSSIESDLSGHLKQKANNCLKVDIPYDSISLESQKDSGYGSSDRNSNSSAGSITIDPYVQYFVSRNMIPPKNINDPQFVQNFMALQVNERKGQVTDHVTDSALSNQCRTNPQSYSKVSEFQNHQYHSDNHSNSSSVKQNYYDPHGVLQYNPTQHQQSSVYRCETPTPNHPPVSYNPHVQTPELSRPQSSHQTSDQSRHQTAHQTSDQSRHPTAQQTSDQTRLPAPHQIRELTRQQLIQQTPELSRKQIPQHVPSRQNNDGKVDHPTEPHHQKSMPQAPNIPTGYEEDLTHIVNDRFLELCHNAEDLMDKCMLAETSDDIPRALSFCSSARTYYKQAMQIPGISQQSFVFAQKRHNACVLKSRSLQRRVPGGTGEVSDTSSTGNRSSITSSDSACSEAGTAELIDSNRRPQYDLRQDNMQQMYKPGVKIAEKPISKPDISSKPVIGKPTAKPQMEPEFPNRTPMGNSQTGMSKFVKSRPSSSQMPKQMNSSQSQGKMNKNEIQGLLVNMMNRQNGSTNQLPGMNHAPTSHSAKSQPDLTRADFDEEVTVFTKSGSLSAQSTPSHSTENLQEIDSRLSVKDLACRFEVTRGHADRGKSEDKDSSHVDEKIQRQRSKSESSSAHPKTALKKKKKIKSRPRKSVTFAEGINLVTSETLPPGMPPPPYEVAAGLVREQDYYKQDTPCFSDDDCQKPRCLYSDDDALDKESCGSTESPIEDADVMCSLCYKKGAIPGDTYCEGCSHYLQRFRTSR